MPKKKRGKENSKRNSNLEELAEELGLSGGEPRNKNKRETFTVRNAGQGQIPKRTKNK